jgi:hypothetical protein
MIAVHFENLLFLLFVAGAFLFQLLTRAASKTSKNADESQRRSTSTPPPIPRAPAETDEERIRKFLEALGQPTTSKPPPPVRPRPTYQKPVVLPHVPPPFASPLPPLTTRPPDLPREIKLPGQITSTREKKTFRPRVAEASEFEVHEGPMPTEPPPIIKTPAGAYAIATEPISKPDQTETNIAALLRSTSGLRNAIILREVFGSPRSLQPLDLVGSV